MNRVAIVCAASLLVLSACSERKQELPAYEVMGPVREAAVDATASTPAQLFSYAHAISVQMPESSVQDRFARARDLCVGDAAIGCKLLSASMNGSGENEYSVSRGQLDVMLPHDQVEPFKAKLLELVEGEADGDVDVMSSWSSAQDVQQEASDLAQRIKQQTDYRDRLTEILKRPNLSVADLIQATETLSRAQATLDQLTSQSQNVTDRIAKERLTITLSGRIDPDPFRPLTRVFDDAGTVFIDSVAEAIEFTIRIIPWLPVGAAFMLLVSWLWRRFRQRRTA